jgi:hypothetical protein
VWAASAVSLALCAGAVQVENWRLTSAFGQERAEWKDTLANGWKNALDVYERQRKDGDQAVAAAEKERDRLQKELGQWKSAFKKAKESDPDCAAQAAQPLRCPV